MREWEELKRMRGINEHERNEREWEEWMRMRGMNERMRGINKN